jgi:aminopeptidase N
MLGWRLPNQLREHHVPGLNLTRAEAAVRSALLAVDSYDVVLDLTSDEKTFNAHTTVKFSAKTPEPTFIDVVAGSLTGATLNGTALDVSGFDGESLHLIPAAGANVLAVDAVANYMNTGEGLHRFVDPADGEVYLYSQFETADARRMYACFDQPNLKATFTLTVEVPDHWEVISNNPVASKESIREGVTRWIFTTTPRISTYITALVAGPYHHVHDTHVGAEKTIPLGIYCRKSLAEHLDAEQIFTVTKQGFNFFEKEFGLAYPFDKYDQIAVAEFNAGAMENAGAVTFAEEFLVFRSKVTDRTYNWRANAILHEMAHMWFGDLVTMTWWDDLWLNESFAEWVSYLALARATRFTNSWTVFNAERKNWAYRQDQLSSTHPIVSDMIDLETVKTNFDGITYAKGASALLQLVAYVGEDNFIKGLRAYFAKYAWGNTTLNDLLAELEAASGRDLQPWVATWLKTAGVNTLRPELTISDGKYTTVAIVQEPPTIPENSTELRPHRMSIGLYDMTNGKLAKRRSAELDVTGVRTEIPELAGERVADLVLVNDGDLSYAKIRFDDRSIATLRSNFENITDPLARALCSAAAWDMLRDAELTASDFVPLMLSGMQTETDIAIVQMAMSQMDSAVELYSAPAHRDALRLQQTEGLKSLLEQSEAGSDHQLAFARAYASAAANVSDPVHLKVVEELLNGSLKGLVLDDDLRWHFLAALSSRGVIGETEIAVAVAKDNTASGVKSAAFARASMPTAEAKESAWAEAIACKVPNHIQAALISGIQRANQRNLMEPFVDRFFESLIPTWTEQSFEMASNIAMRLYPIMVTKQETLDATKTWLAKPNIPAALYRLIAENRDALERALNAQKFDAQRSN